MSALGEPVHAEVDSADASGGIAFMIYPMGSSTARTLLSTEYFYITDILADMPEAAGALKIVADTDAAGKRIFKATFGAMAAPGANAGTVMHHFETPFACEKGVVPKLFAPAGQVTAIITGYIKVA
jgi:hypothetical protein